MSKLFELVVPTYVSVYISHEEFLHVSLYTTGDGGCSIIVRAFFRHILLLEHTHKCRKPHKAVSKPVLTTTVDQTVGRMLELPQSRACYRMSLVVNVAAEFSHEMEFSFCDEILHC